MWLNTESLNLTNYMPLPVSGDRLGNRRKAMEGLRDQGCPFQRTQVTIHAAHQTLRGVWEAGSAGGHKIRRPSIPPYSLTVLPTFHTCSSSQKQRKCWPGPPNSSFSLRKVRKGYLVVRSLLSLANRASSKYTNRIKLLSLQRWEQDPMTSVTIYRCFLQGSS